MRKQQELSHKEALLQLEHINAALTEVLKDINLFASWWSAMETHLLNIKVHVQKFGASNLDSLSLEHSSIGGRKFPTNIGPTYPRCVDLNERLVFKLSSC